MERALMGGVVLTGGATSLPGLCDIAESVLNCQARKGLPFGIADWPEDLDDPAWTVAAGLAMYSAKLKVQSEMEKQTVGVLARLLSR
jgi:cell division protein FtsA